MTSMDSTQPDHSPLEDLLAAQIRERRLGTWSSVFLAAVGLAVVVLAGFLANGASDRADQANRRADTAETSAQKNGELIAQLTTQVGELTEALARAETAIIQQTAEDIARENCEAALARNVNRASYNQEAAVTDLVGIIGNGVPGDRQAAVAAQLEVIATARAAYDEALKLEASYTAAMPADPCPVPTVTQ